MQSPSARDRGFDLDHDPYVVVSHREEQRSRRSSSPSRLEGSRRFFSGDRMNTSIERRDYDWHSGGGDRRKQFRSRSPPYTQVRKGAFVDEDVLHRNKGSPPLELRQRYEPSESMDFNPDAISFSNLKHVHAYGNHNTSRKSVDKDFDGNRLSASDGHGTLVQKSIPKEDNGIREFSRLHEELGPISNYKETGGPLSSSAGNMGIGRFEDDMHRYRKPLPSDKSSVMESYREGEKSMLYSRDANHPSVPACSFRDLTGTSSGMSRGDDPTSYRDTQKLHSNEYPRSTGKFIEDLGFDGYDHGQRPHLYSTRDLDADQRDLTRYQRDAHDADQRDLTRYQRDAHNPSKADFQDYLYPALGERESDEFGYPPDEVYRKIRGHAPGDYGQIDMPLYPRVDYDHRDMPSRARLDYDHRDMSLHARIDHHRGDVIRSSIMDSAANSIDDIEGSRMNLRKGNLRDHLSLPGHTTSKYPNMSRRSYASQQEREFDGSGNGHVEFERKVSREHVISHSNAIVDHKMSHLPSDYDFERDTGTRLQKDRLKGPYVSEYDTGRDGHAIRWQRMEAEKLGMYDRSGKMLKRKYIMEEETSRYDSRSIASRKFNMHRVTRGSKDGGEECVDEDINDLYSSETVGSDRNKYRRADRVFDGRRHHRDMPYDEWLSNEDSYEHVQGRLSQSFKPDRRYVKGHPRPGSLSWYNPYHSNRRNEVQKHHNVWIRRTDDHYVNGQLDDDDPSEDWTEPPLDTEKFKQLVQRAFFRFSKKLNENPAAQRRYKEQGRAGSLFCIVCGRSDSKDFMDTQRLVTHAFMSHKSGMRAQHLGLHKAICVLLGWSTVLDPDTVTWIPQVLPNKEAVAQKEDLILWPPLIIIHNSSHSNNNSEEHKVVTTEDLEDFLRGKGFVRAKIKVCLGKPANTSIMIVKFLGTFSGLENADKLHKYFTENKRGRVEFEKITSTNGRGQNIGDAGRQGDKLKELDLYGYMGIAEDLDKVDYESRRRSLIQSKKEIRDLVDDPVKPNER